MQVYYKTVSKKGEVIGLGYIDLDDPQNMVFETFKDMEGEQIQIDINHFIELAKKKDFIGMKPIDSVEGNSI